MSNGSGLLSRIDSTSRRFQWNACAQASVPPLAEAELVTTRVVNLRREAFDVYIGRAGHGWDGTFGNPFRLTDESQRGVVLERFRAHFLERVARDVEFRRRVLELRGKRLGCFCAPRACHGDVIAGWLDAQPASRSSQGRA